MRILLYIAITLFISQVYSQTDQNSLENNFEEHLSVPEENIYLHLNKSLYLPSEDIGFAVYVYDQKSQQSSIETKNVYCQLINGNGEIIKQKLLLINEGRTNDIFSINSLIPPGEYKIKAFTRWMKNFDDPELAVASLKVLDPDQISYVQSNDNSTYKLDVFPEGGHLVNQVFNRVGVILKNQFGVGVEVEGAILKKGKKISTVKLDSNGIGSFLSLPELGGELEIEFKVQGVTYKSKLPVVKTIGITLSTKEVDNKLLIELKTNKATLINNKKNSLIVAINGHNKLNRYKVDVVSTQHILPIELDSLQPGMNQISLFNENGEILSKRLFFNHNRLRIIKNSDVVMRKNLDTLSVNITFENLKKGSLSVSVLPVQTIASRKHDHIVNKFLIEPYLNGTVQNPAQYFQNVDVRTRHNLDNLLLVQGWTMYNWDDLLKAQADYKYAFENGIGVNVKTFNYNDKNFYLHPSRNTGSEFIDISDQQDYFIITGYFPTTEEKFRISKLDKMDNLKKTKLYPRFFPNQFAMIDSDKPGAPITYTKTDVEDISFETLKDSQQQLDTIVLKADINKKRNERISNLSRGRVDFFSDADRRNNFDILQYLRRNGFNTSQREGEIVIRAQSQRVKDVDPIFIIDGNRYFDSSILIGFQMSIIDYIAIDTSGFGGAAGTNGGPIITIKTDPRLNPFDSVSKTFTAYDVPLTFSVPEKFYRPNYVSYNSNFYNKLGVMDWKGKVDLINGNASFTTPYLGKSEVLLIIEGMTTDGTLIHEEKVVKVTP